MIEKSVEEMIKNWDAIESGRMKYDDPQRAGQCHRPMKIASLRSFAIMHQKLRSLDNCLKLLYHIVAGQTHTWSETNANVKDALKAAKNEVIATIRQKCGFLVDCPTVIGGNTNTGPIAERFFSPENREAICSLILKSSDQSAFSTLLAFFNKMLTITQQCDTSRVVKPDMLQKLGQDHMVHYKQSFPWAMISPSKTLLLSGAVMLSAAL